MIKTALEKVSHITPEQIFVAYAEMRRTREAFPKTKGYHEKRWRLITGLFEIPLRKDGLGLFHASELLDGLASRWWDCSYYNPLSTPYVGRHPEPDFSIASAHKGSLARKAAAMRSEYEQMGAELLVELFPEIKEKHVSASRLHQLGLPLKAPNENTECLEWFEENHDKEEEGAVTDSQEDNIPKALMDELKLAEEARARAEAALALDVAAVRKLALEQELATECEIDRVIYEMGVPDFLKLASAYPRVSRVHFNPDLKATS